MYTFWKQLWVGKTLDLLAAHNEAYIYDLIVVKVLTIKPES